MLRTRVTLRPGAPGTKKLLAEYGSRLVAVRYRYDDERETRCKTIELVIEEIPWSPNAARTLQYADDDLVQIWLAASEPHLRRAVRRRHAWYDPHTRTWTLRYADALALRLTDRIRPSERSR